MADKVWLPDASHGFLLGKIVEFADEGPVVQPVDRYGVQIGRILGPPGLGRIQNI